MKTRLIKSAWILAAVLAMAAVGYSQDWRGQDGYRGFYQDRDNNRYYRDGFRDGQNDARHGHSYRARDHRFGERDDRNAYLSGYEAGFNQGRNWNRGGYGSGPYYGNGGYSGYGNGPYGRGGYGNQAFSIGYQDGLHRGSTDRATGHSYRPTHDDDWHHADRGYNGSYGSKQAYKDQYRSGYMQGYERGYRNGY